MDYVLASPDRGDESTYDSDVSARNLGGLTQEPKTQSQSLLQRESTTASQAAKLVYTGLGLVLVST